MVALLSLLRVSMRLISVMLAELLYFLYMYRKVLVLVVLRHDNYI
jgi:hypothetical protein